MLINHIESNIKVVKVLSGDFNSLHGAAESGFQGPQKWKTWVNTPYCLKYHKGYAFKVRASQMYT